MAQGRKLLDRLMRKKPIDSFVRDASHGDDASGLKRSITLFQLTMFGVGATVGTGIFFVMSQEVPRAGPAIIISFIIAGITAGLTALCYAEMCSMIPVSGSSYSYAYATMGEGIAFLVAVCLILEYGIADSAVAVGWSEYLSKLLTNLTGLSLPDWLTHAPITTDPNDAYSLRFGGEGAGIVNLPAMILVFLCCLLLLRGAKESARTNAIMVVIKLAVLTLFIVVAGSTFKAENLTPFAPHGMSGVGAAAGAVFFSFIGLDAVSTAGEEVINPKRNLPLAIMLALAIVTIFYILVALAALGAQPADQFNGQEAGLATILENITGSTLPGNMLAAGAVISIFSVTLVLLYGQTRIFFVMSRDGMLPPIFHRISPRTMSPDACTIIVACAVAMIAGFVPAGVLWDMTSMGTLVAFTVVSLGVIMLRRTRPDMPRGFRVPLYPVVPVLSVAACAYLISQLSGIVFILTGVWVSIAAVVYLTYSMRHSKLETGADDLQLPEIREGAAE